MNRKAQAAMEYLMTYGWAILIVIIVAAALYALGVFNPATWTGTRATGFANIGSPVDWRYGSDGSFNIMLKNSLGSPINITSVVAKCGASNAAVTLGINPAYTSTIGAGGTAEFYNVTTPCAPLTLGSSYSIQVQATYTKSGGAYTQTDTGTVTGSTM